MIMLILRFALSVARGRRQARAHGDGPNTSYWLGNQPISRAEYYALGGR